MHSPLNCLPGAGWEPVHRAASVPADGRRPAPGPGRARRDDRRQPLRHREGPGPAGGDLLVPEPRPRGGQRVLGQDLHGAGRDPPEPHGRRDGPRHLPDRRRATPPAEQAAAERAAFASSRTMFPHLLPVISRSRGFSPMRTSRFHRSRLAVVAHCRRRLLEERPAVPRERQQVLRRSRSTRRRSSSTERHPEGPEASARRGSSWPRPTSRLGTYRGACGSTSARPTCCPNNGGAAQGRHLPASSPGISRMRQPAPTRC